MKKNETTGRARPDSAAGSGVICNDKKIASPDNERKGWCRRSLQTSLTFKTETI